MNVSTVLGYVFAIGTIWFCIVTPSANPGLLLNPAALGLILGGTIAATFIIFPFSSLKELTKFLIFGVFFKRKPHRQKLVRQIVVAAYFSPAERHLLTMCPAHHPFLAEGFQLIAENKLSELQLKEILTRRSQYFRQAYLNDAKMLAIMAKFPSSLGMLGSTVGLIDMMTHLGSMGQEGIGPAMAMALVSTFWGLILTYMLFMPLSDYAQRLATEDFSLRQMIVEGLLLLKRGERQQMLLEHLNGFLALSDRMVLSQETVTPQFWSEIEDEVSRIRKIA
jgi:chemotaxis protein MotA